MTNPLVAERQDSTTAYSGIGIVESAVDIYNGVSGGSWVEGGLGLVGGGLETLSLVVDPVGTLLSYGVSWLMEHVKPLSDALDWLAGDGDTIASYAQTWRNVSQAIGQARTDFDTAVRTDTAAWTGSTADAYRQQATGQSEQLGAAATSADTVGTVVEVVGVLVGVVREVVRDLIADCVATLIARIPQWLAMIATGVGIPVAAGQAATLIARWVARISDVITKLVRSVNNLRPLLRRLDEVWEAIRSGLRGLTPGGPSTPGSPSTTPAGSTTPAPNPSAVQGPTVTPNGPASPSAPGGTTPGPVSSTPDVTPNGPGTPGATPATAPAATGPSPTVTPGGPTAPSTPSPSTPSTSAAPSPTVAPSGPSTPAASPAPTPAPAGPSPTVSPDGPTGTTAQGASPTVVDTPASPSSPGGTGAGATPGATPGTPGGVSPTIPSGTTPATPATPSPGTPDPATPGGTTPSPSPTRLTPDEFDKLSPDEQLRVAQSEVDDGAVSFTSDADAVQYGRDHWNDYVDNLPPEQRQALFDYTMEPPHTGPTYQELNAALRNGPPYPAHLQAHIDNIDAALAGNPITETVVISRGTGLGHIGMDPQDMVGQTFTEDAYLSTSLGGPAPAFASKDAVLHLQVPPGTPALWVENVSAFGAGERELLIGRGMQYHVDRVVFDGNQWHVYGQYLPVK